MSHIAIVRSSARAAHAKAESQNDESAIDVDQVTNQISRTTITSLSSSEGLDSLQDINLIDDKSVISTSLKKKALEPISTYEDLLAVVDQGLSQENIISQLEIRWSTMMANHDNLIKHLESCNAKVTGASIQCLESLDSSVESTCDRIHDFIKSFEKLMTRCDETVLNLRVTEDFREEVKSLRKYIDTLSRLLKSIPKQTNPINSETQTIDERSM